MQRNKTIRNKKAEGGEAYFEVKPKHDNLVTSLDYTRFHKAIIYVTTRLTKNTQQVEGFTSFVNPIEFSGLQ